MKNEDDVKAFAEGMIAIRATWWDTFLCFRDNAQKDLEMDKVESVGFALKATSNFITSILKGYQKDIQQETDIDEDRGLGF